jgi:hypothetical protein
LTKSPWRRPQKLYASARAVEGLIT